MAEQDVSTLSPELRTLLLRKLRSERRRQRQIEPQDRTGERPRFPLSWPQRQLWFLDRYLLHRAAYNVPVVFELGGDLHLGSLRAALEEVVRRHEILRTTYSAESPEQIIHPPAQLRLPVVEVGGETEAGAAIRAAADRPFDLVDGGVVAAVLCRLSPTKHLLLLNVHHIATDGWSTGILTRELESLYETFAQGRPAELPALPIQYADFAVWQRDRLEGPGRESLLAHWQERLAGAPQLDLPLDRPRPKQQSLVGGRRRLSISPELAATLRATAADEQVTVFAILLAAFQELLHKYTRQRGVLVGVPFANRGHSELESLIGFFVNTLPVRIPVGGEATAREAFQQAHVALLDAQDHQELPFEAIVDALGEVRDPSRSPVYQAVFSYQSVAGTGGGRRPAGVRFTQRDPEVDSAKFDLTAAVWESDGRFAGDLVYDAGLFDAATIERFASHLVNLLDGMLGVPEARLRDIDVLTTEERRQLTSGRFGREELGPPPEPFPPEALLSRLFELQAEHRPDAVALSAEGNQWTYDDLNRRANRLAHRLLHEGVGPEVKVGLCHERSGALIVGILGILKAGGVYVPLDPSYPQERLRFIAEDAGLQRILTAEKHLEALPGSMVRDTGWLAPGDGPETDPPVSTCVDGGAYVIYTSGSTGRPKGVAISHWNVLRLFERTRPVFEFGESDAWTLFHSYAFDFSVWEIWGALLYGGRLVVVPHWVSRSPDDFLQLLARDRVTVLNQSPSAFRQIFHDRREVKPTELTLRYVVFGAEALDWRILDPWFRGFGGSVELVNMYGITETTVHVTHRRAVPGESPFGSPVGWAIDDLDLYVRDEDGHLAPIGVPGEIYVGGPGLARGYLHRPHLSAERFGPNPFSRIPGERLYRSGDTARFIASGELVFLGRNDDQVKIRGFRIELGEVQAALAEVPEVQDALVLADQNPHGASFLAAYLIAAPGASPSVRRIREALGAVLPDYMVPARFVVLEAFPLTAHGKLDRRALPEAWEVAQGVDAGEPQALQSATEEVLAALWSEVLGGIEVGREDNFFALGGDSILSLRVLGLARDHGMHFSLQDLFQLQTVKRLAREITRGRAGASDPAPYEPFGSIPDRVRRKLPEDIEDAYPLAKLQLGMLYEMRLSPELLPYHNVDSVRLRGRLDRGAFLTAVRMLSARHPIFRTSLHLVGYGEPIQMVHRETTLPAEWHDLRDLPAEEREAAIEGFLERERRNPFDLRTPGLLRFTIHRLEDELFQFSLTECHAILDGWSLTSSIAELFDRHFRIVLEGDLEPLPRSGPRYGEFVAEERRLTASEEARDFWRGQVEGLVRREIPKWPEDHSAGDGEEGLNEVVWKLPPDRVEALRKAARAAQVPLKTVFLAGHTKVLSLLLGTGDVQVGLQSNGRPETEDGGEVYGLYLNALPLRIRLREGTWKDLVQRVFQAEWAALPYRAFPMAEIQEMAGGAPLFEAFFNFVRFHSLEDVIRTRHLETVGDGLFYEPNHFPLLAGFNLDPVSDEMTAVLQSARREFPQAQLLAIREYYDAVFAAIACALGPEAPGERHDLWAPPGVLHGDVARIAYSDEPAPALLAAPASEAPAGPPAEGYEAPATPTEEILAAIWSEVLGFDRVGRDDGFFTLGGDSLLSLRALAAADERGASFSLQQLYEIPTLRELAHEIDVGSAPEARAARTEPFSMVPEEVRRRLPPDAVDAYPMASLQLGMLYHMELDPELLPYHNVDSGLFRARLERELFLRAVQLVVDRHPVLRTGFEMNAYGEPLQVVYRTAEMPIVWEDLRDLDPAEQEGRIRGYLDGERARLFDIRRPPLLHYAVHRLSDDLFRFSMTENHILLDGWSFNAILAEVFSLYWRILDGETVEVAPAPEPPYREFISLEREAIGSEESRRFWRELLAASPRLLVAGGEDEGDELFKAVEVVVSGDQASVLERRGREWMVPLKTVLLAAHLKVLSLLADAQEVVTGLVTNGRPEAAGGSEVYGLFLNTVPLPLRVPEDEDWADLVARVFRSERDLLPHRRVPMGEIQSELGGGAIYEVMFNYISFHSLRGLLEREDFEFAGEIRSASPTHYPLAVNFNRNPVDGEIVVILQAGTRRLSRRRLVAVGELYRTVLASLAEERPARPRELPAGVLECRLAERAPALPDHRPLSAVERHRALVEWNDTAAVHPAFTGVHRAIEEQARATPEAVALVFGERTLSYGELDARADRLARRLRELGVGPSVPVGIAAERSPDLVIGVLAILKAGGAYVPFDPSYPEKRLAFMLRELLDAAPETVLLTGAGVREIAPAPEDSDSPPPALQRILLDETSPSGAGEVGAEDLGAGPDPADLAYVIYTSGSTGRPKGVMNSHRGILNRLFWTQDRYRLEPGDRVLQKTPISFDVSVWELFWPLMTGAQMVLARPGGHQDTTYLAELIARRGVTLVHFVPSILEAFLRERDLSACGSLRAVLASGEALSSELVARFVERFEGHEVELHNLYGPTEAAVDVTSCRCDQRAGEPVVPLGRPVANTQIHVLSPELEPVPPGVPGQLMLAGVQLATGYLGRPGRTAAAFTPHPFRAAPGARLYQTGDLACYRADGEIDFLGRIDHQVKLRGVRIELGEIESALRAHDGVREAVVVLHQGGNLGPRLVGCLVPGTSGKPDRSELRSYLAERLPEPMVPSLFAFFDAFPLTPSGKTDRSALAASVEREAVSQVPPRTPVEEILAAIWCEVLALPEVGVEQSFVELGGHSLLAMRMISRVRDAFHVELPLRDLFELGTIAALAAHLEAAQRVVGAPPVTRRTDGGPAPLSFSQERLWVLDRFLPESSQYNIPKAVRLFGPLRVPALAGALRRLESRHESLRTTFREVDGVPLQIVSPPGGRGLAVVDLSAVSGAAREAETVRLARQEAWRPFDLARGPLHRSTLLRLATGERAEHALLFAIHHAIADAWSLDVFFGELAALYTATCEGRDAALEPLPVQYADYAAWQRDWLTGEVLESQIAWWREHLAGAPPALELPGDRPLPKVRSWPGGTQGDLGFRSDLASGLTALSRRHDATLFMTLFAAFQSLLYRHTGQTDIVVGLPVANRNRREIEGVIGFFVNTVALRTDLSGSPKVAEVLGRVRDSVLGAHPYQELPFEKLVAEMQPDRDLSRTPLFQVMFVFHHAPEEPEMPGLSFEPLMVDGGAAKFDLLLALTQESGGPGGATGALTGEIEYDRELFDGATVRRFSEHLATLLEGWVHHPERGLDEVSLLRPAQEAQLLREWNPVPRRATGLALHHRFEAQVQRTPDATALVFGDRGLSYRELDRRAYRLAHRLVDRGVGPGAPVGLFLDRSIETGVSVLAALKAGGVCVPLDPAYPAERLRFMIDNSDLAVVLTVKRLVERLQELAGAGIELLSVDLDAAVAGSAEPAGPEAPPARTVDPDQALYVIYTSGSTGRPKGVELPHRVLDNLVDVFLEQHRPGARTLQFAPLSFDVCYMEMFSAWSSGGSVHGVPEEIRKDVPGLARWLAERRIETAVFPVVLLHLLAEEIVAGSAAPADLRDVISTGEQMVVTEAVRQAFLRPALAGCRLHNHYGPSETHVVTTLTLAPDPLAWEPRPTIGRAIANVRTYVTGPEGRVQPLGVPGELLLGGGAPLAQGYLGRPGLTAARFVPDPWAGPAGGQPGDRVYHTGDLARLRPDGEIEYLGRVDRQVKLRGFRIELGEIEALLRSHDAVDEAVALLRSDGGDPRLVAYAVPAAGGEPEPGELLRFLARRLPDFMVPSACVLLERLPLSPNGKIDRAALPEPQPSEVAGEDSPRTAHEELLAGIWAAILDRPGVGIHDDFFALGGHSLLATRLVSRIRSVLGVELALRAVFEAPTIALLAERTESSLRSGHRPLPAVTPRPDDARLGVPLPLSFSQRRLWFLDQLQPASPVYNIPVAMRVHGRLDPAVLAASFQEIVRRHEALRTTLELQHRDEPVQVVAPPGPFQLSTMDLTALAAAGWEPEARRLAREESLRPFSLREGPLLRAALIRLGEDDHVLLLTMHHVVSDGWSMGILVRELGELYRSISLGTPADLPELPVQYADFALWQQQWMRGGALEDEHRYWLDRLGGLEPLDLPLDRPRPAAPSRDGASRTFELPDGLSDRLEAFARDEGVTLFMALLAVFQGLLGRYTGRRDLAVGTPVAGRNLLHTEDLIGVFINTLVLRTELPAGGARELLSAVRETTLGAYAHQNLPFETLVEELQPERDVSRTPLVDVMFGLHNQPTGPLAIEGLRFEPFFWDSSVARFDLAWSFEGAPGELRGGVVYKTELFDGATIERMIAHFGRLLAGMLDAPERPLEETSLLSGPERHQLVYGWNDTARSYPPEPSLARLFEEQARRTPEAVALEEETAALSYGELDCRASRFAHRLRDLGVGPEARVGLYLERSMERAVALLGTLKAGSAFVPLDPEYPRERIAWMLGDSALTVLVARGEDLRELPEIGVPVVLAGEALDGYPAEAPASGVLPESSAYVLYTSGSTGRPKGAVISQRALVNHMQWQQEAFPLGPADAVLHKTPLSFDPSVAEFFAPLWVGARLALAPPGGHRDIPGLVSGIARHRVTHLQVVPTLLEGLVAEPGFSEGSSLRRIYSGGEILTRPLAQRLRQVHGATLINVYGPTEAAISATSWHGEIDGCNGHGVPLGRSIANTSGLVLDRGLRLLPVGVRGELFLGGLGLGRGYLNRPGRTAESFLPHPFGAPGERLYRTGDRVRRLPDGTLDFLGRFDLQLKVRGQRIEPGEIEAALESHPEVARAAVVLVDSSLVGYVEASRKSLNLELRELLRSKLPQPLVPRSIVVLDALPHLPNGKVDRGSLQRRDGAEGSVAGSAVVYRPAREPLELELARIWEELLEVDRVGLDDDFFALGGHSLVAVAAIARIERRLGTKLPLTALFQAPTLEALALRVREAAEPRPASPLVPLRHGEHGNPWFLVHPVGGQVHWYLELARSLGDGVPAYALQAPGLVDAELVMDDVQLIAETYLEALHETQPEGPYFLAGWSAGGAIAFEMARTLRDRGETVGALVLIDAPRGMEPPAAEGGEEVCLWIDLVRDLSAGERIDERTWRDALTPLPHAARLAYVAGDLGSRGLLPPGLGEEHVERMLGVYFATRKAVRSYEPGLYPGAGTLVRAAATSDLLSRSPAGETYGWGPYFTGGIALHDLPGDHYSILSPSGAEALAALLTRLHAGDREVHG